MKAGKDTSLASRLLAIGMATMIVYAFMFPAQARATNNPVSALPTLEEFVKQVGDGDADTLRGAYIPGILALPVVQQPGGNSNYVSPKNSTLTQFSMANKAGNVGLLAHNYLAGRLFFEIRPDDLVILVYGNARTETFTVESVHRYEALPNGAYKNVEGQNLLSIGKLFEMMYGGKRHVTLQTCIAKDRNLSWGRLFVVAKALGNEDAQTALPKIVVAPPPPPVLLSATSPAPILGWPLTRLKFDANKNAAAAKP